VDSGRSATWPAARAPNHLERSTARRSLATAASDRLEEFTAFCGEQQAAVALVAAVCIFLRVDIGLPDFPVKIVLAA
jgi:hypothetical protein